MLSQAPTPQVRFCFARACQTNCFVLREHGKRVTLRVVALARGGLLRGNFVPPLPPLLPSASLFRSRLPNKRHKREANRQVTIKSLTAFPCCSAFLFCSRVSNKLLCLARAWKARNPSGCRARSRRAFAGELRPPTPPKRVSASAQRAP